MKRLIYITYLGLLAVMMMSCEKEEIVPAAASSELSSNARGASCTNYAYQTKTGPVQLGTVHTREILVEIDNSLTLAQKAAILSKYKPFRAITGEFNSESGLVTIVELKLNTSCLAVEQMLAALENEAAVRFALPTFVNGGAWDEFFVVLSTSGSERDLRKLVLATNTRIVGTPDVFGPKTYLLSADKNSTGNIYEMVSYFNTSNRVAYAEPAGFIFPINNRIRKHVPAKEEMLAGN